MAPERQPDIRLTGIHIDLVDRVVILDAEDGRKAKLSFGEPAPTPPALADHDADNPDESTADDDYVWEETMAPEAASQSPGQPPTPASESREKQQTTTLTGNLRTQPRSGRPDSQGRPTAWARFAAEDSEQDRVYSATFHRAAAPLALSLTKGAQLTIEGYLHPADPARKQPGRLSVIVVHNYPGKAASPAEKGVM